MFPSCVRKLFHLVLSSLRNYDIIVMFSRNFTEMISSFMIVVQVTQQLKLTNKEQNYKTAQTFQIQTSHLRFNKNKTLPAALNWRELAKVKTQTHRTTLITEFWAFPLNKLFFGPSGPWEHREKVLKYIQYRNSLYMPLQTFCGAFSLVKYAVAVRPLHNYRVWWAHGRALLHIR